MPDPFASELSLSDRLDAAHTWFGRHTLAQQDSSPQQVAGLKRDCTIAAVIPARNEAATVGAIVEHLHAHLLIDVPLLDEIIVVDSHSSDSTAKVAAEAGATVVECGAEASDGKGGALRSGIDATTADVVVFLDADLTSFHDGYVTALVAPLLTDPHLHLVKAFYDRPFSPGGRVFADAPTANGGRVTELVARPTIGERAPELSGFAQPLAGEYAVRRDVVAAMPLVSGYGVDVGLLLSLLRHHGLDSMAQADLGRRVHRHQDLTALGRMALQVRAAFDLCLDDRSWVRDRHTVFVRGDDGHLVMRRESVTTRLLAPPAT